MYNILAWIPLIFLIFVLYLLLRPEKRKRNFERFDFYTSEYYLSQFDEKKIEYRTRDWGRDDENTEFGVVDISQAANPFEVWMPANERRVSRRHIDLAKKTLANIVEMDAVAHSIATGGGKDYGEYINAIVIEDCLLYTSPSPRDKRQSRMPSSA